MKQHGTILAITMGILVMGNAGISHAGESQCQKTHTSYRYNGAVIKHLGEDSPADCLRRKIQPAKKAANNGGNAAPQATAPVGYSNYRWVNARAQTDVADHTATTTQSASSKP